MISKRLVAVMDAVAQGEPGRLLALEAKLQRGGTSPDAIPVSIRLPRLRPENEEPWEKYLSRAQDQLAPLRDEISATMGIDADLVETGNALAAAIDPDQVRRLDEHAQVELIELNDVAQVASMDDSIGDVELAGFRGANPPGRGRGVRVAVLDSGVDGSHPFLRLARSVSVIAESDAIPGPHGTHCAGSIASRDSAFPGIAPECELYSVKVLDALGRGTHVDVVNGVTEAIRMEADILSMSLGFNHLPTWSTDGHGWACPDGDCVLCRAVDSAVALGKIVVVAAGNQHEHAQALRQWGHGASFDTELGCPGQANDAITVGALTKRTFLTAPFSSRGPTAYGTDKPDLSAPGVNVTSTVPVPRDGLGNPIANPGRDVLFAPKSGTSMATPIVAGAAALLVELRRNRGETTKPAEIRSILLGRAVRGIPGRPRLEVGAGRLDLSGV